MTDATAPTIEDAERRAGFIAAALAYMCWGVMPLYFKLLAFADVREVLAQRILWSAPAALLALFAMSGVRRGLGELGAALKPRMLGTLALSALFIFLNWGTYVWLVLHERVIESALAYFLAPLVSVAIGTLFFGERISMPQVAALGLATAGVIAQGFALGAPPWMALAVCATWSAYAVIRKRAVVPAATGFMVETLALAPIALGLLFWAQSDGGALAFGESWPHAVLLAISGPITALPLVLFAFGARRVTFIALGLLQFLAPTLQFATGIAFGEPFTPMRAASFGLIWIGLAIFAWDTLRRARTL